MNKRRSMIQFEVWRRATDQLLIDGGGSPDDGEVENMDFYEYERDGISPTLNEFIEKQLIEKKAHVMCTLFPDILIKSEYLSVKVQEKFTAVIMVVDVSGFTAMSEKYNNTGRGGTYKLTSTMNTYTGLLVEIIYKHGGDVHKFAGDAILAVWKLKPNEKVVDVIHDIISCACHMQNKLGSYETDIKVVLKVKIAITSGTVIFTIIGDDRNKTYVMHGEPMQDVKVAEQICSSGEIVVSPITWTSCNSKCYRFTKITNDHIKILRIISNPPNTKKETLYYQNQDIFLSPSRNASSPSFSGASSNVDLHKQLKYAPVRNIFVKWSEEFAALLRPFIIRPLVIQIESNQTLEYLTEMRQVTAMFIRMKQTPGNWNELIIMIDLAYQAICKIIEDANGCVNKVICFDKDVVFLVVFGLRGYKHILESRTALKAAYSIYKSLKNIGHTTDVSVGISTGMAYCGVVGHPLRREYTVIGSTVNIAARIASAYPGKVCCCRTTMMAAKMATHYFTLQESKWLKGLDKSIPIYEYTEDVLDAINKKDLDMILPCLGRSKEEKLLLDMLKDVTTNRFLQNGLLFMGDHGVGKSRLLDQLISLCLSKDYHIATTALHPQATTITPFCTIYNILRQIMRMDEDCSVANREDRLTAVMVNHIRPEDYFYLNEIMKVSFPVNRAVTEITKKSDFQKLRIFRTLCKLIFSKSGVVIAIDDIHHIDKESWYLLADILSNIPNTLLLMTIYINKCRKERDWEFTIVSNKNLKLVTIEGIENRYLASITCQMLSVSAIPALLNEVICDRSSGYPGWVESFLVHLNLNRALKVTFMTNRELMIRTKEQEFVIPPKHEVQNIALHKTDQDLLEKQTRRTSTNHLAVCEFTENFNITEVVHPHCISSIVLTIFDKLYPYERSIVEIAAVVSFGGLFTRKMLEEVARVDNLYITLIAIRNLFVCRIFECGTDIADEMRSNQTDFAVHRTRSFFSKLTPKLRCYCPQTVNWGDRGQFPRYAHCALIKFCHTSFRNTVYDFIPRDKKKILHARSVKYLENEAHMCFTCGGGAFATIAHEFETESESEETLMNILEPTDSREERTDSGNIMELRGVTTRLRSASAETLHSLHENVLVNVSYTNIAPKRKIPEKKHRGSLKIMENVHASPKKRNVSIPPERKSKDMPRSVSKSSESDSLSTDDRDRFPSLDIMITMDTVKLRFGTNTVNLEEKSDILALVNRVEEKVNTSQYDIFEGASIHSFDLFDPVLTKSIDDINYSETTIVSAPVNNTKVSIPGAGFSASTKSRTSFLTKLQERISILDFRDCVCNQIMEGVYQQLIYHCANAGLKRKQIQFQIECGAAAIFLNANLHALLLLHEVGKLVKEDQKPVAVLSKQVKRLYMGQIYTLIGHANMNQGLMKQAEMYLLGAMKQFGLPFRKSHIIARRNLILEKLPLRLLPKRLLLTNLNYDETDVEDLQTEISKCLLLISNLFMYKMDDLLAKLAAIQSIHLVQSIDTDLEVICNAFSTAIDVCTYCGDLKFGQRLENSANTFLQDRYYQASLRQLAAVGKLFCSTFYSRLLQGNIATAIRVGFRTLQISNKIYENKVKLKVIPLLIQMLVMNFRIMEAVDLNIQLQAAATDKNDMNVMTWFYALCLEIYISSGFKMIPTDETIQFALATVTRAERRSFAPEVGSWRESNARKRLVINVWLYSLRTGRQDCFGVFEIMAIVYKNSAYSFDMSFNAIVSSIKLVECQLIQLVYYIEEQRSRKEILEFSKDIKSQIKHYMKVCKGSKIMLPRIMHLRAYHVMIEKPLFSNAQLLLTDAEKIARGQENYIECAWINHSRDVWTDRISDIHKHIWVEREGLDWHQTKNYDEREWSNIMYSLELPRNS